MYKVLKKRSLNESVTLMEVHAPHVARKALPGQFVIYRVDELGERVPLTIAGSDPESGAVTIIFQKVGHSTRLLDSLNEGDALLDFVGPLGEASRLDGVAKAAVVAGGLGCAIAYPQARALRESGAHVDLIAGFRSADLIILSEELAKCSTRLDIVTDDGSNGRKGFVTDALRLLLESGERYDVVVAIGPLPMMKAVCELTRGYGVKTVVSMNPVMIDGTGMCGCCRVTVGGRARFACVDGPDFDGHLVDFDEAIRRSGMYREQELEKRHICRLTGDER